MEMGRIVVAWIMINPNTVKTGNTWHESSSGIRAFVHEEWRESELKY